MSDTLYNLKGADPNDKRGDCWSKAGSLTTGNGSKTQTLQYQFPSAGTYTVQFKVESLKAVTPTPNGGGGFNESAAQLAKAEIEWAVAGNTIRRVVTIFDGMSVTGVGEGVRVRMMDDSIPPVPPNTLVPQDYEVIATVAKGVRANTQQPATFVQSRATSPAQRGIDLVGTSAAPIVVDVPDDSGITSVYISSPQDGFEPVASAPPFAKWVVTATMNGPVGALKTYRVATNQWVPIVPGTVSITIALGNVVAPYAPATLEATVTFGVDG